MNMNAEAESIPTAELEEIVFTIFDWERRCWQWDVCAEIVTDSPYGLKSDSESADAWVLGSETGEGEA